MTFPASSGERARRPCHPKLFPRNACLSGAIQSLVSYDGQIAKRISNNNLQMLFSSRKLNALMLLLEKKPSSAMLDSAFLT
jgi:hypothetical protein